MVEESGSGRKSVHMQGTFRSDQVGRIAAFFNQAAAVVAAGIFHAQGTGLRHHGQFGPVEALVFILPVIVSVGIAIHLGFDRIRQVHAEINTVEVGITYSFRFHQVLGFTGNQGQGLYIVGIGQFGRIQRGDRAGQRSHIPVARAEIQQGAVFIAVELAAEG